MNRLVVVFLALAALVALAWPKLHYSSMSKERKLDLLIEQDLGKLALSGHLPKSWSQIRSVELSSESGIQNNWLKYVEAPIKLSAEGNRHLEMQVLPFLIDGQAGAVVNYTLIDTKTQNTVWEFGRTFQFQN